MAAGTVFEGVNNESQDLFRSVFPPANHSTPTPQATPEVGSHLAPGQSFGGFNAPSNAIEETLQINRAWSLATGWLSECLRTQNATLESKHLQAVEYLLAHSSSAQLLSEWYINEITSRFREIEPSYATLCSAWLKPGITDEGKHLVEQTVQKLISVKDRCLMPLNTLSQSQRHGTSKRTLTRFCSTISDKWTALVMNSSHRAELQRALAFALFQAMTASSARNCDPSCFNREICQCPIDFDDLPLEQLSKIGLGADLAEHALGSAVNRFLAGPGVERRCFQVDWEHHQPCMERLRVWIERCFAPAVELANKTLTGNYVRYSIAYIISLADTAVINLGRKRTDALFDYVKVWPHSQGAVEDIKVFLALDRLGDKAFVCSAFKHQIQRRLLHAGASTSEILGVYANLINVFKALDARGVLLEKVTPAIKHYLRARTDTVNIAAESFLVDADDDLEAIDESGGKVCIAIAQEVHNAMEGGAQDHQTFSWNDMSWVPEPIDAGPNHKSSKSDDVLSYIFSLFDQEDFFKEVTSVLAEHLLQAQDSEVVKETRLVELLKTRFEAGKLQDAEVMLKDVRDSVIFEKRITPASFDNTVPAPKEIQAAIPREGIALNELYKKFEHRMKRPHFQAVVTLVATKRNDLYFPKRGRLPQEPPSVQETSSRPQVKYRILSSHFWPQMQNSKFALPSGLAPQLRHAEERFSSNSGQRKLEWRPALGRMSITLDLEDRTVTENNLPAWRAMVIDAFSSERGDDLDKIDPGSACDYSEPEGRTAEQLVQRLEMPEELVQEALNFWTSKRVLFQRSPGVYAVLERLDMDVGEVDPAATQAQPEGFSALKSQDAMLKENAEMFEAFIANMLRNGGPKEVDGMLGITNMLKMVLPTFTYGDDEVKWLLGQMQSKGVVQRDGELWVIASR